MIHTLTLCGVKAFQSSYTTLSTVGAYIAKRIVDGKTKNRHTEIECSRYLTCLHLWCFSIWNENPGDLRLLTLS